MKSLSRDLVSSLRRNGARIDYRMARAAIRVYGIGDLVTAASEELGQVDMLVACAGVMHFTMIWPFDFNSDGDLRPDRLFLSPGVCVRAAGLLWYPLNKPTPR